LKEHYRAVLSVPLGAAATAVAFSFALEPQYTAEVAFVPEQKQLGPSLAGLAGLASQVGISLGGQASESPQFYGDLLRSDDLRAGILRSRFQLGRDTVVLLDLLAAGESDSAKRFETALRRLGSRTAARVDARTNVIRVSVELPDPGLAAQVANAFAAAVDQFNQRTRSSRARERRTFVEARAREVRRELDDAEDSLRVFYERNRGDFENSPSLANQERRLRRQVDILTELYLTLRREEETSRVEEFNDLSLISVVDSARVPVSKSSPKRSIIAASALIVGVALVTAYSLAVTPAGRWRLTGRPVFGAFFRSRDTGGGVR
jgi:uncharacterized protein involved in exopolysaccharide biosynthesis